MRLSTYEKKADSRLSKAIDSLRIEKILRKLPKRSDSPLFDELREQLNNSHQLDQAYSHLESLCDATDRELEDAAKYGLRILEIDREKWSQTIEETELLLKAKKFEEALQRVNSLVGLKSIAHHS